MPMDLQIDNVDFPSAVSLVSILQRKLDITREQAEGGAGVMLQFVHERLTPGEFRLIADTIEAISDLIGKAPFPSRDEPVRFRGWLYRWQVALGIWWGRLLRGEILLWRWTGGLGPLATISGDFASLGLSKSMIAPFAAEVIPYFSARGGEEQERLLRRVLR